MKIEDLQNELKQLVGIKALVIDSDLMINKDYKFKISKRRVVSKPNFLKNYSMLIEGINHESYIKKVLQDSIDFIKKTVYIQKLQEDENYDINLLTDEYILSNFTDDVVKHYEHIQELIVLKLIVDLTQEKLDNTIMELNNKNVN